MQKSPWGLEQKMSAKQVKVGVGDSEPTEGEKQKQVRNKGLGRVKGNKLSP